MTFTELCTQYRLTVQSARRLSREGQASNRWKILILHTDGTQHQLTLTVRSQERPSAPAILRAMVQDARSLEEAPKYRDWCKLQKLDADSAESMQRYHAAEREQSRLMRFLSEDLYKLALDCVDDHGQSPMR